MNKAVFLDRDGTIIKEKGFICNYSEVEIFSFTSKALRILKDLGFLLILTTNQSAIARGICSIEQVNKLHYQLNQTLSEQGAKFDGIYFCPYLQEGQIAPFNKKSKLRKPEPGMILKAARDFQINLKKSLTIGDSCRDIISGKKAGTLTALVKTGKGEAELQNFSIPTELPDFIFNDILQAAEFFAANPSFL